jgi:hypothetical protein
VLGATKVGRHWVIPSPPVVLPPNRPRGYFGHQKIIKERNRLFEIFCKHYGERSAPEFFAWDPDWIFDDPIIVDEPSDSWVW